MLFMRFFFITCLAANLQCDLRAEDFPAPASLSTGDLAEFAILSDERKALVSGALDLRNKHHWLKYTFGSADPDRGGFDCSGAMYHLLTKLDYEPGRSSAGQYLWLQDAGTLHEVDDSVTSLEDDSFDDLKPGDLVFWSGTYQPTDGRKVKITHVGIYLGTEKKDGRAVMACSTNGRSYRGRQANGYGVYDFRLPSKTSKSKLVGYGTPPAPADK